MLKKHLEQHGIRTFGLNTDLMYRTEDVVIFIRTNSSSMEMTVTQFLGDKPDAGTALSYPGMHLDLVSTASLFSQASLHRSARDQLHLYVVHLTQHGTMMACLKK